MTTTAPGDLVFPSGNYLDVPDLDPSLQAVGLDAPFVQWGSLGSRKRAMRGTWGFYVDDYRFSAVWGHPETVTNTGCCGVVEPNYSVFDSTPVSVAVWATYRKRWLARYWQSAGIRVWVDLNVSEAHSELNLLGVPQGWRAFATRGYADRLDDLEREAMLAKRKAGREPMLVVYGGGEAVADRCRQLGFIHAPEGKRTINWKQVELEVQSG